MKEIKVSRMAFVDAVGRVLFEDRKGLRNNGFRWDYLLFGGKINLGETPEEALVREIREELSLELNGNFVYLGTYESDLSSNFRATDYVYAARLPQFHSLKSREGRGIILIPIYSARRTRIPPVYNQILDDLETALRNPNFLPH